MPTPIGSAVYSGTQDFTAATVSGIGGQTLGATVLWVAPGYPLAGVGSGQVSATPAASQSKAVVVYRMMNPGFASLPIKQVGLSGFSGTGKSLVGIFDSTGALVQESATITSSPSAAANIYTFTTPPAITGSFYYLALSFEDTSAMSVATDTNGVSALTAAFTNANFVYAAANAATQPGGAGTTMHMPATLGALTKQTGAAADLIMAAFASS